MVGMYKRVYRYMAVYFENVFNKNFNNSRKVMLMEK